MTTTARQVIFGTGAIGLATLRRRGETARLLNRSGHARVPDDVVVIAGDARDPAFTTAVAESAQVIYQTLNPPYAEWTAQFPLLQAGVLTAAEAAGARLVSMENVYMYGRPDGRLLTEDRAYDAHATKGQLRGRMARELLGAHDAGRVEVAIGRASDYFGPTAALGPTSATASSRPPWPARPPPCWATPTSRTRTRTSPTSAKASPSWVSTPTRRGRSGTCPTTPTPAPPVGWSTSPTDRPGSPRQAPCDAPGGAAHARPGQPDDARAREVQYQFAEPFVVDSSKITNKLGAEATPLEQALADTLRDYRDG